MSFKKYILLITMIPVMCCLKKDLIPKVETLYASSIFRENQVLEGVPELETFENITKVSICLLNCLKRRPDCMSFNWGKGECLLLSDSVCANETLLLTPKEGYAYYDVMDSPDFEKKHLKDKYCQKLGKCSGKCYPRKPHYFDTPMTRNEAQSECEKLGRVLPQPRSYSENQFYANFIENLLKEQPKIRNNKDMKYWFGISDEKSEDIWIYDDSTPVTESFSAWALGQPDNGGPFGGSREDCGAIGEKGDFKWFDVNCNLKLKFFCA